MTVPTLWALAAEHRALAAQLESLDLDDQTIADTLAGESLALESKAQACVSVLGNLRSQASAYKQRAEQLAAHAKAKYRPGQIMQAESVPAAQVGEDYISHVAAVILEAQSVAELSPIHDDAMAACKAAGDREAAKRIKKLLLERRAQLEAQP